MKIALYIEDGLEQIVLTPETKTEEGIVGKLTDGSRSLSIKRGGFYPCQGGWTRHHRQFPNTYFNQQRDDDSVIIVLRPPADRLPTGESEQNATIQNEDARK